MHIDLNCDLGEGAPHDAELMPLVTSANIACGAHAGDEATMKRCIDLALAHGTAIGAHPGYEDRENFGRTELTLSSSDLRVLVLGQIRMLQNIAVQATTRLTHVKPHGALYNQAARDPMIASAIADAIYEADPTLVIYGLAGSELIRAGKARGLSTAREIFADRRYQPDGNLVPRSHPHALITDTAEACAQTLRLIRQGIADTVCLHGDGAHAVAFAHALRHALQEAGIPIKRFTP
ncbi:LamB/YcsF family protein [Luteolibacter ambystomatis]|uniref:LamB/YcsF family protein n=1 Tax=Luteolibacter ambystomatis TaxID=2824561 RepID=A0A975J150_9BACT|nr:5-oxoprolinase subunit PxpA [Luteolibacter ambystomatis]QUE52117.1 LamB/YcsF family protein [Luteolibacter ambystomatis]